MYLNGYVFADDGSAIVDASVEAYSNRALPPDYDTTTDSDGHWEFDDMVDAGYWIRIAYGGSIRWIPPDVSWQAGGIYGPGGGAAAFGDSSVTESMLGDGIVTVDKLGNLSVATGKIANLAVTTGKIANSAVTSGKLDNNAVISGKVADSAINTLAKIVSSIRSSSGGTNNLVQRDGQGRFRAAAPVHDNDVATKAYVDSGVLIASGSYAGDGSGSRNIVVGFTPKFVSIAKNSDTSRYMGVLPDSTFALHVATATAEATPTLARDTGTRVITNGFRVGGTSSNAVGSVYQWVAIG